jgi:hypothetical protein
MKRTHSLLIVLLITLQAPLHAADKPLSAWHSLVRIETWTEKWPNVSGEIEVRAITAEVWTQAIQAALDAQGAVHIPARDKPYYLDGPIVLKSRHRLTADATAEMRLKPGTNTCMVRNEHLVGFAEEKVPADTNPDTGITIEGGIWTTLATSHAEVNGNRRGHSSTHAAVPGTHGVVLLHNVRHATVRNVTVRQSSAFAVHLGNIRDFTVDGLTLDNHGRDGVHLDGPASDGIIRRVGGASRDDKVALVAWDWQQYGVSYGPIHHIVIEQITGAPKGKHGIDAIRLLPGVKRFSDGSTLDCPIHDIVIRDITDIRVFKLYDQPNLELGRDKDASVGLGRLENITFENLICNRSASIQVHANTDGLTVRDVKLLFPVSADFRLIELGPRSQTYPGGGPGAPEKWTEIFSPDLDCTVRNLTVSGVRAGDEQAELATERLVKVMEQKINRDYPRTTPKGGTGKGIWIR